VPFGWQRCPAGQVPPGHVQMPPEQVPLVPALQLGSPEHTQLPELHTNPVGQARPQAPQLVMLVDRSKQPAGFWQQTWEPLQSGPPLQLQSVVAPKSTHTSPGPQVSLTGQTQSPDELQLALLPLTWQSLLVAQPHRLSGIEPSPQT
jgi:hypothetical protein